mmetsp:Transcript_19/g.19  ORF Transcript_19/g.19 Transcript_19/m.19 type:complete len:327 (+) Transcript_19:2083-3063(+)
MFPPHLPVKYGFDPNGGPPPEVPNSCKDVGHFYKSFDDRLWMLYRLWTPLPSDVSTTIRGTLMIVHGTVDHSGVYDELASSLTASGFAVIAMDMRGWGLSDGESMYVHDMETFCRDVEYLSNKIHSGQQHPQLQHVRPQRRFLLGKSIGGLITAFCVGKYFPDHWKGGLIGLSGAYQPDPDLKPSTLQLLVLKLISKVHPKFPLKHLFDPTLIVKDEQALQAWKDDPLCCKDKVRVGYGIESMKAMEELSTLKIEIPLLVLIGDDDHVVSGHESLMEVCRNVDQVLLLEYPQGRHNLLQEPSLKQKVIGDISEWLVTTTTKQNNKR